MSWEDPTQYAAWERLVLAEYTFPGLASAEGSCHRDVDVLKQRDADGAPFKDNGYEPTEMEITVRYLSKDHDRMREIVTALHPRTQGINRAPLSVALEQVNFLGITQIYLKEISTPQIQDGIGSVVLRVLEYMEPTPAAKTKAPRGVKTTVPATPDFGLFSGGNSGVAAIEGAFADTEGLQ
jgi:hypothetical protein